MAAAAILLCVVLFGVAGCVEFEDDVPFDANGKDCDAPPLTGIEWVISRRLPDYGWGEDTHRAIVILELNNYGQLAHNKNEIELMRRQLEVEITGALIRGNSTISSPTELALYVQALLATKRDPRDFYGLDLVKELTAVVDGQSKPHPFLVLVLCGAHAVQNAHLQRIREYIHAVDRKTGRERELAAIAVKAFACAISLDKNPWSQFRHELDKAAQDLASFQKEDGGFGNLYASALIYQALKVYNWSKWEETKAENFLLSKEKEKVNMLSIYLVQMALHAHEGLFLSSVEDIDIHTEDGFISLEVLKSLPRKFYVQYTLKVGELPELYPSLTIKVPSNITFFDVMRLAADEDDKFKFSYNLVNENSRKKPIVYRISGIPNDAENGLYWRLVHETGVDHVRHVSNMVEMYNSPADYVAKEDSHYVFWFCDIFKELSGVNAPSVLY